MKLKINEIFPVRVVALEYVQVEIKTKFQEW